MIGFDMTWHDMAFTDICLCLYKIRYDKILQYNIIFISSIIKFGVLFVEQMLIKFMTTVLYNFA